MWHYCISSPESTDLSYLIKGANYCDFCIFTYKVTHPLPQTHHGSSSRAQVCLPNTLGRLFVNAAFCSPLTAHRDICFLRQGHTGLETPSLFQGVSIASLTNGVSQLSMAPPRSSSLLLCQERQITVSHD